LISRTGEEIVAREVFSRFKTFADHEANVPMDELLQQMSRAARVYRKVTLEEDNTSGQIDRVGLFAYRIKAMESDVMKSALLALLDPEQPGVPPSIIESTLDAVESWLTRRMLVRATTKSYPQVAAELVAIIRQAAPDLIDQKVRSYLTSQTAEAKYWPDDAEMRSELTKMPIYRKVSRSRLRMVLEAIEDYGRGYRLGGKEYAGMRVPRNAFWVEHIMPQSWEAAWKAPTEGTLPDRAQRIHTFGNLTLLTAKLNSAVSNGPWLGVTGKKAALRKHDLLILNRDLDSFSAGDWTDETIIKRTQTLIEEILDVWNVPPGYKSSTMRAIPIAANSVDLSDLLSAGLITAGQKVFPQALNLREHIGQVLPDGGIDVGGNVFETPSGAAFHLRKKATNGWSFWLTDLQTKKSLASIRREYLEKAAPESNLIDDDDDGTTGTDG
jgi:hypothetical protein